MDLEKAAFNKRTPNTKVIIYTLLNSETRTTYFNTPVPSTTLCDGHPRLLITATTIITLTYTNVSVIEKYIPLHSQT